MKYIDISHRLNENTPNYPGDLKLELKKIKSLEEDYYSSYSLSSGMHTGTHIDMPMHLIDDNRKAADFPLECFSGNGVLLDMRGQTSMQYKDEISSLINEDDIVLLYSGFDKHYLEDRYFNDYPSVSEELGDFLLSKNIKMLGMDTPAPDYIPFNFHKALLRQNILVLENLTNLGALIEIKSFEVIAFPLKIDAEASLVRAVCKIP